MTDIDYRREAEGLISAIDGAPADTRLERVAHWLADFLDRLELARYVEFEFRRIDEQRRLAASRPKDDDCII